MAPSRFADPARWSLLLALLACSGGGGPSPDGASPDVSDGAAPEVLRDAHPPAPGLVDLRPLSASADRRIVDDQGRDVLLRGVNVTSLGEYWQGVPTEPPTLPTTEADWEEMADRGVSVVRLVVHWSRLEPTRGVIDPAYVEAIDAYVRAAAARGIYTVLDMHQDAYTAALFTPPGTPCPAGTGPARGWDGAPAWAVFSEGLSTCTPGERNASPAVRAAWNAFYDNREGVRDRFVQAWAALATRFAGRPEVAGYDLLNEPEVPRPAAELTPLYEALIADLVRAIRAAEAGAPFVHLLFVEPALPAGEPSFGLVVPDPRRMGLDAVNVVSAPHNYAETIGVPGTTVTFEAMNQLFLAFGQKYGVPTWIGEYGFWDTSPTTLEKLARYAADEDRRLLGGAWWQWRQPCGDPHSVGPTGEFVVTHLHRLGCPGNQDLGPTGELLVVLGRGYPRAAPGRLTRLESDPATGELRVEAMAPEAGGTLLAWTPTTAATHAVELAGLRDLVEQPRAGGRLLSATVTAPGAYTLRVTPR